MGLRSAVSLRGSAKDSAASPRLSACQSRFSSLAGPERGHDWAMVGTHPPVRYSQNVGFIGYPKPRHRRAEQDVIQPAVRVVGGIKMRPGHILRFPRVAACLDSVPVAFSRASINQSGPPLTNYSSGGLSRINVAPVTENDQLHVR